MALRIERIPTWTDNYTYLLVCDETGEAAVVDAPELEPVAKRVATSGARLAVPGTSATRAIFELRQTLARFTEGADTADLRVAREFLEARPQAASH